MAQEIVGFGGGVRFTPRHHYSPRTEREVLEILDRHAEGRIRVVGSLHSWSGGVECDDVIIDLRHLRAVRVEPGAETTRVQVGGGCTLKRLLRELNAKSEHTLPTLGAITEQTIAGAISTGTHGSGKHSISHYVDEVRVAAYDRETGRARIYEWREGPELRAARCGLGCMGVVLSVGIPCVPKYSVESTNRRADSLEEVLAAESEFPLQQFALLPYLWRYFVFQRRETRAPAERTAVQRVYNLLMVDVLLHLLVKPLAALDRGGKATRTFYREFLPRLALTDVTSVDRSDRALVLEHELFSHSEMEVFLPAEQMVEAMATIRALVEEASASGQYTHHYPLFCRRILADDTLISMAAGEEAAWYSVGFFCYLPPERREAFLVFCRGVASTLARRHGARLHWGKVFPLAHAEVAPCYPRLAEFREICERTDPRGVFRNAFIGRVLGF